MTYREELETTIRETARIIHQYETILHESSDPKEQARACRTVNEQTPILKEYLTRYGMLCQVMSYAVPDDIVQAAILHCVDLCQPITPEVRQKVLSAISPQERFNLLPTDTLPDAAPLPTGSRMPYIRNPLFVGRVDDLKALAAALKGGATVVVNQRMPQQVAAATGLGGIGKTQLAAEFTHRYGHFFAGGVFWLSFADAGAVSAEVAECGRPKHMDLPGFSALEFADQVGRVQREWESELPRLLIFDNCEDEALLDEWRPTTGGCRILITSRRTTWESTLGVYTLPLGVLAREESIALLRNHRVDISDDDANAIAAELDDLPLALHLAGSYLARYRSVTPEQYLEQVRQPALLKHRSMQGAWLNHSPTSHEHHVGRTFALSYDKLDPDDAIDSIALALLARAAHFAPSEPVPRDLLIATVTGEDESEEAVLDGEDGLHRLLELGLLEEQHPNISSPTPALRLHRLLAAFVQESAHDKIAQVMVEWVMTYTAYDLNMKGIPAPLLALATHLRHITEIALQRGDEQAATLASNLGFYLKMIGDYSGAKPYYQRALAIREQVLGPYHPDTAQSLNNLAALLKAQGDYAAAHPLYARTLAIREQVLGPHHPDTASSLNNLALLCAYEEKFEEATELMRRALSIFEAVLGDTHPHTQSSRQSLEVIEAD